MIVIVQTHAGNRFIGEIEEQPDLSTDPAAMKQPALPKAGESFVLRYPLAYMERPNENGQTAIIMPPVVLAGPVEEMPIVGSFIIPIVGSGFAQLRKAYDEACQVTKAALSGIVRAHVGALRALGPQKQSR